MKIINSLKKHRSKTLPVEIINVCREDLPELFIDLGFKVGAEIGVEFGNFSEVICKKGLNLYSIDPWANYSDYKGMEDCYNIAKEKLSKYPNSTIIRKFSLEALKDFEDESLDFVYIDGAHDFQNVTNDIIEWTKKVRKGGIISGHDYIKIDRNKDLMHVKQVVNAYTDAYKINPWYVLGRKDKIPGEIRDNQRSWFWFKQ